MTDLRAAQQALETLEKARDTTHSDTLYAQCEVAITALRASLEKQDTAVHMIHCNQGEWVGVCKYGEEDCPALAQQEQEPVAIVEGVVPHLEVIIIKHILGARFPKIGDFLYTSPPRREWQSLSEEEIGDAQDAAAIHFRESRHGVRGQQLMPSDSPDWWLARAIEAALKEKNA